MTARSFTPAAERLVSLAGAVSASFDEAATRVLPEMAGLKIAETTVQRTSEGVGARLGALRRDGRTLGFTRRWDWHRDALGRTCAYVSLDLTGVRQQAKDGSAAEGRMPYVAMVYNPVPELPEGCPYQPPAQGNRITQPRYSSPASCPGQVNTRMIPPEVARFRRKTHGRPCQALGVLL